MPIGYETIVVAGTAAHVCCVLTLKLREVAVTRKH